MGTRLQPGRLGRSLGGRRSGGVVWGLVDRKVVVGEYSNTYWPAGVRDVAARRIFEAHLPKRVGLEESQYLYASLEERKQCL